MSAELWKIRRNAEHVYPTSKWYTMSASLYDLSQNDVFRGRKSNEKENRGREECCSLGNRWEETRSATKITR